MITNDVARREHLEIAFLRFGQTLDEFVKVITYDIAHDSVALKV
jgi:hypothetical protein